MARAKALGRNLLGTVALIALLSVGQAAAQTDRDALIALYNATGGEGWNNQTGWKEPPLLSDGFNEDPCLPPLWFGVACQPDGRIAEISLSTNSLTGEIPAQLGSLSDLRRLYLIGNRLRGAIPPELGNLTNLQRMHLDQNLLSGSIPPQLTNLASLQRLGLDANRLSGAIPSELSSLPQLDWLVLSRNGLSGTIPPKLGDLATLEVLDLSNNNLSGTIPPELGRLSNLVNLTLHGNELEGSIPPQLGDLANLTVLELSGNRLSGPIAPELGSLGNLRLLFLGGNRLSGALPLELSNLSNLAWLFLEDNQLSGTILPELGNLASLTILHLSGNQFGGEIPSELCGLEGLQHLSLARNQLTGSILPKLGSMVDLKILDLSNNQFSGTIPPQLGSLSSLRYLGLGGNQLEGAIPPELEGMDSLLLLELDRNLLSGMIPPQLRDLDALSSLDLRSNGLYTDSQSLRAFLNSIQRGGDWESSQTLHLYFAHFAAGSGLGSEITLFNLNDESPANARIEILDSAGQPLAEDLVGFGQGTPSAFTVPASGSLNLRSEGLGNLRIGWVKVTSNRHLEGAVIFGGDRGLAGVGASPKFAEGLRAPILSSRSEAVRTGVAVADLSGKPNRLILQLLDASGVSLAAAEEEFKPFGQMALFADEIPWNVALDLSEFLGTLVASSEGPVTATVLQTRPDELVTMPVAPLIPSQAVPTHPGTHDHWLNFAHFADGDGLSSQILLLNLDSQTEARAEIFLRDSQGNPLNESLGSPTVDGSIQATIAPAGLRVLATDGQGGLSAGSAQVASDLPLAGVIVFSGAGLGSAGVGASEELAEGFQAPMETDRERGINTGVAIMNLEGHQIGLEVELLDAEGRLVAFSQLTLEAMGQTALFVDQFEWDQEPDFSNFEGSVRVRSDGRTSATVIQVRPGQFATLPVEARPAQ